MPTVNVGTALTASTDRHLVYAHSEESSAVPFSVLTLGLVGIATVLLTMVSLSFK